MAKTKAQKEELVAQYQAKIKGAKAIYFIEAKGIIANDTASIKKDLYDLGSSMSTLKNRIFSIALKNEGLEKPANFDKGQYNAIFANEKSVGESAKIISEFMKEKENIKIAGGILDAKVISSSEVVELAELPSKDVMIARLLSTLNSPITGFVNVLSGNIRGLVNVLNAVKDQKPA